MEATNYSYFPRWSSDLSHALESIDPSTMPSEAYNSDLIYYINYDSSLSPININQHIAAPQFPSVPPYYLVPQYQSQPYLPSLHHNNFHMTSYYPHAQQPSYMPSLGNNFHMPYYPQELYGYSPMQYYPMQQYDIHSLLVAYDDLQIGFVDGVAIILMADYERSDDYEDLLDLPERMGPVNVGLSEETILKNLKTSSVHVPPSKDREEEEEEGEICAVCQDEYKVNETIGTLQCGHCYHANCIKEWLLRKNVCPICKAKALIT